MFREKMDSNNCPLLGADADSLFQNISGCDFNSDYSFTATVRALVSHHMPEGDGIFIDYRTSNFNENVLRNNDHHDVIHEIAHIKYRNENRLTICDLRGSSDGNKAIMDMIDGELENLFEGWERVQKCTDFFVKTFRISVFVNKDLKSTIIFANQLNIRLWHFMQLGVFLYFPWYFEGYTETENPYEDEIIKGCMENKPDRWMNGIKMCASRYDFRSLRIKRLLDGFENCVNERDLRSYKDEVVDIDERIESKNRDILDLLNRKRDYEIRVLGLLQKIAEGGSNELMDYFLCNKRLHMEKVDDGKITFVVKDYLEYFDEDIARTVIDNDRSYMYRPDGNDLSNYIKTEDMRKLYKALFYDQTLKLRMCCAYRIDIRGYVEGLRGYTYKSDFNDCMPNPHINRYACLGNYQTAINDCLHAHNYIGAIEQCLASCRSLNFADSPVMTEFALAMYGRRNGVNNKCIELPDGNVVTSSEAIVWLYDNEEKKEENEETTNE